MDNKRLNLSLRSHVILFYLPLPDPHDHSAAEQKGMNPSVATEYKMGKEIQRFSGWEPETIQQLRLQVGSVLPAPSGVMVPNFTAKG